MQRIDKLVVDLMYSNSEQIGQDILSFEAFWVRIKSVRANFSWNGVDIFGNSPHFVESI